MKAQLPIRPAIEQVFASVHDKGTQLELSCTIDNATQYFAAFVADANDESLFIELFVSGKSIQIPVSVLESAIESAKKDVHSESWYDRQNGVT